MTFEQWFEQFKKDNPRMCTPTAAAMEIMYKSIVAAARPQWQPIETAPVDVAVICSTAKGRVGEACFITGISNPSWYWTDEAFPADGDGRPTHWMPLPEAPKE